MRRFMLSATLAVAAIALLVSAAAIYATEELPFKATLEWTRTSDPGVVPMTLVGTGNATHVGDCTGVNEVTMWVDESGVLRGHATPTITDTQGDQIFLEVDQVWNEEKGRWEGTYWITGGAGKFEGASGSGANKAKPTATPGVSVAEFEGTIIY
ncbi:MAG: hypothetical protein ACOX1P_21115 [Thermoguttaceae bacterium]|jgi:hypothetical protein